MRLAFAIYFIEEMSKLFCNQSVLLCSKQFLVATFIVFPFKAKFWPTFYRLSLS